MPVESMFNRITGAMMKENRGKSVCILGEVVEVDNSGTCFKLRTGDNVVISIFLEEPHQDCLEGFVEVIGNVTNATSIVCHTMVAFPPEITTKFVLADYNTAVKLVHQNKINY